MKLGWPNEEMSRRVRRERHPWTGRIVKQVYQTLYRAELDVVGRIGHRFIVVSCKVGRNTQGTKAAREVESLAQIFGRFTIPFLVQPKVTPEIVEKSIEAKKGAVHLGIQEISDPGGLREILERVFEARRLL